MIPQRSGGARELRDGETVKVCLADETILNATGRETGISWSCGDTRRTWWWTHSGKNCNGAPDIVEILGPAAEDHGDGTVTRVVTLPVTLDADTWAVADPIAYRLWKAGEFVADVDENMIETVRDSEFTPELILRPKTPPVPPIVERIAELIEAGEVVLPPNFSRLIWVRGNNAGWVYDSHSACGPRGYDWDHWNNGPLPKPTDTDPTEITRAEIDAARERIKSKGGA